MKIFPVIAENWKMDGGVAFGVVPKTIWKQLTPVDENNLIRITTRCLLVDDGDRVVLFDTGMGRKQSQKYYGFRHIFGEETLNASLLMHGYKTGDITDVVFTHLHDDHCGGAITRGEDNQPGIVFENAMHHCSRAQWEWANNPNKREVGSFFKENFSLLMESGKMNLIEAEGPFTASIELRIMNGHTRGMVVPIIHDGERTIVFAADFIPLAANIPLPFIASVDIEPLKSLKEKQSFLAEAAGNGYYLVFEHDYSVECCTLMDTEKGIRMKEAYSLHEILV